MLGGLLVSGDVIFAYVCRVVGIVVVEGTFVVEDFIVVLTVDDSAVVGCALCVV